MFQSTDLSVSDRLPGCVQISSKGLPVVDLLPRLDGPRPHHLTDRSPEGGRVSTLQGARRLPAHDKIAPRARWLRRPSARYRVSIGIGMAPLIGIQKGPL